MPNPGEEAPDLILRSTEGEVRLSDLWSRGKLVLAFYTEDGTPLCSTELAMLRDDYGIIQELGASVAAASSDTLESHADFASRLGGVPFPLLSDVALKASSAYEVVDDMGKRCRRAIFVIDEGGRIVHAEPWFQPGKPAQYEAVFLALGFHP